MLGQVSANVFVLPIVGKRGLTFLFPDETIMPENVFVLGILMQMYLNRHRVRDFFLFTDFIK